MRIAVSQQAVQRSSRSKPAFYRYLPLYISIAPFYILFAIFGLFPLLFSLYLAFQQWDGIGPMRFVGWNQFAYLFTDRFFWQSLANTLQIWLLATIPMLSLGLVLACLLSHAAHSRLFYQVAFLLPHVTSVVAITIIFGSFFGNHSGLLNAMLAVFGLRSIAWLNDPLGSKIAVASIIAWRGTGYNALIYLAGLQSIPAALYEAARIDGASTSRIFFSITIPLLKPVLLFTIITSTISGLQIFTEPQVLFNGGQGGTAMTMVLYLYQQAFEANQFGYGAAIGWGLFVIVVVFSVVNWQLVQRPGGRV